MSKENIRLLAKAIRDLKHYSGHVMVGLVWAWVLREIWQEFVPHRFLLAIIGSLIIDLDHFLQALVYGRKDWYGRGIRQFLKKGQVRNLWIFIRENHKHNTGLVTHNIYFLGFFLVLAIACFITDRNSGVVFFGAMVLHLIVDILDDIWVLGRINENWKRLKVAKAKSILK